MRPYRITQDFYAAFRQNWYKNSGLRDLVREATQDVRLPVDFLLRILAGRVGGVKLEHKLTAAKELLDWGYGKPAQSREFSGPGCGPVSSAGAS